MRGEHLPTHLRLGAERLRDHATGAEAAATIGAGPQRSDVTQVVTGMMLALKVLSFGTKT